MTKPQDSLDALSAFLQKPGETAKNIDEIITREIDLLALQLDDVVEGQYNGMEIKASQSMTKPQKTMENLELMLKPILQLAQGLALVAQDNGWEKLSDEFDAKAKLGQPGLNIKKQEGALTDAVTHWLETVAHLEAEDSDILPKNRIPAGQIGKPLAINDSARITNEISRVTDVLVLDGGWKIKKLVSDEQAAEQMARSPHHRAAEIS